MLDFTLVFVRSASTSRMHVNVACISSEHSQQSMLLQTSDVFFSLLSIEPAFLSRGPSPGPHILYTFVVLAAFVQNI